MSNWIKAHVYGRRRQGNREEISMKLFSPDGAPFPTDNVNPHTSGDFAPIFGLTPGWIEGDDEADDPYTTPWVEFGTFPLTSQPWRVEELAIFSGVESLGPPDDVIPKFQIGYICKDATEDDMHFGFTDSSASQIYYELPDGRKIVLKSNGILPLVPMTATLRWRFTGGNYASVDGLAVPFHIDYATVYFKRDIQQYTQF